MNYILIHCSTNFQLALAHFSLILMKTKHFSSMIVRKNKPCLASQPQFFKRSRKFMFIVKNLFVIIIENNLNFINLYMVNDYNLQQYFFHFWFQFKYYFNFEIYFRSNSFPHYLKCFLVKY